MLLTVVTTKMKKKRPGMAHFSKQISKSKEIGSTTLTAQSYKDFTAKILRHAIFLSILIGYSNFSTNPNG